MFEEFTSQEGIETRKLEPGTIVIAETKNSIYSFEILDNNGAVFVDGGEYFPQPKETHFIGSTWGGSMLKMGWIGHKMHMEIVINPGELSVLKTSPVQKARIVSSDWVYEMEWNYE